MVQMKSLHRELSSCRRSCLLWIRSSGTGKGGGRGTENKKGGGKGEEGVGDGLKLSAQRTRCCSHHLVPAATSIELRLAVASLPDEPVRVHARQAVDSDELVS